MASYELSANQQSKKTNGLKMNDQYESKGNPQSAPYQFRLDIDIRKTSSKPISQGYGKSVYEVEWINRDGPPIILLQIDGARAKRDASFYVELSCHSHIIRTYGLVHSSPSSTMLLQEPAPQGNLSELLCGNEFTPNERVLWEIFEQICDGMIFLVDRNIIHGDLACRNVLVFQMNPINPKKNLIKLTDFGLTSVSNLYSVVESSTLTTMTIIPTRYAAPELLKNLKKLDYSEQSDVYSMGVLMWEACAYGKLPYSNINDSETIRQHKLKDKRLSKPSLCGDRLWAIINECWEFEPKNRPPFRSLHDSISHLQSQSIEKPQREITPNVTLDPSVIPLELNRTDNSRSYEDVIEQDNDKELSERNYDRFYSNEESLNSHQASNIPKASTSCPFCQERQLSLMDLRDHLVHCGTKTDQCPRCYKFIQRAFFAYHYENNCANVNEIEGSKETNNSHPTHSSSSRNDQSYPWNKAVSIPCQFCQEICTGEKIHSHQESCSKNPNCTRSPRRSMGKNSPALPHDDQDDAPLLADGTAPSPAQNQRQRPEDQRTNRNEDEHSCCCCS